MSLGLQLGAQPAPPLQLDKQGFPDAVKSFSGPLTPPTRRQGLIPHRSSLSYSLPNFMMLLRQESGTECPHKRPVN